MPVLPSGNWIQDLPAFSEALHSKAWRVARTDATALGGITPARKAMVLAETAGMNCEIMCWGNTLISAANLHLMLAFRICHAVGLKADTVSDPLRGIGAGGSTLVVVATSVWAIIQYF